MKKKAYIIFTIVLLLICPILYRPFKISAFVYTNTPPFVGEYYYIENYDNEYKMTMSSNNGTFTTEDTSGNVIALGEGTMSNGKTYYSTGLTPGGVTLKGKITLNLSSTNTQVVYRIIRAEIVLDDDYVGYFHYRVRNNGVTLFDDDVPVNGNRVSLQWVDNNSSTTDTTYSTSVSNVMLVQSDDRNWSFPIESFNFVDSFLQNNYKINGFDKYNNYVYPIFSLSANSPIFRRYLYTGEIVKLVFFTNNTLNVNNILNYFSFSSSNYSDLTVQSISRSTGVNNSNWQGIYQVTFKCTNTSVQQISVLQNISKFIPIYANTVGNANGNYTLPISTDFALQYGLSNELLDNLDIIANGNNQSDQSVSDSDTTNQQAQQVFQQEEQLVNNAEQDLKDNLDNLDIQNQNNNLFGNSKFVASAQWVKLQFDNLTNNNAFGYMITFSLVIGLTLVIVGKLRG